MPTIRTGPAPATASGKVRIALTMTAEESATIDDLRGSIPASTWCRDAVIRACGSPTPKPPPTLDLPPAPEGMRWACVEVRRAIIHLVRPINHCGVTRWKRACHVGNYARLQPDPAQPEPCPACVAIATKGVQ